MGITFDPKILIPTVLGDPWLGNSTKSGQNGLKGVSNQHLNSWEKSITPLEVKYCNTFLIDFIHKYNYGSLSIDKKYLYRCVNESLKTYIRNRMFLKYANIF